MAKTKRFASQNPGKTKIGFKKFRSESPCKTCPKVKQGLTCWCAKLGEWQKAEFGEVRAAWYKAEAIEQRRCEAAKKAWETRRKKAGVA